MELNLKVGDKVNHKLRGIGTVVSINHHPTYVYFVAFDKGQKLSFTKEGYYFSSSQSESERITPVVVTFAKGDTVRLKEKFYDERVFKDADRQGRGIIASYKDKELTVYGKCSLCDNSYYLQCGGADTHMNASLLEKVEKPIEKPTEILIDGKAITEVVKPKGPAKAKIGDWVESLFNKDGGIIQGGKYRVIALGRCDGDLYVKSPRKSEYIGDSTHTEIKQPFSFLNRWEYTLCPETATKPPVPQYREVNRPAKVGDRVKVVKSVYTDAYTAEMYQVGDILTVDKVYERNSTYAGGTVECGKVRMYKFEYVVLEPIEPSEYLYFGRGNGKPFQTMQTVIDKLYAKPQKRQYTAEQIQEAKRYVADKMYSLTKEAKLILFYGIDDEPMKLQAVLFKITDDNNLRAFYTKHINLSAKSLKIAYAKCEPMDTYNEDIGKMVAVKKLFNEPLPSWVKGY